MIKLLTCFLCFGLFESSFRSGEGPLVRSRHSVKEKCDAKRIECVEQVEKLRAAKDQQR